MKLEADFFISNDVDVAAERVFFSRTMVAHENRVANYDRRTFLGQPRHLKAERRWSDLPHITDSREILQIQPTSRGIQTDVLHIIILQIDPIVRKVS